MGLLFIHGIGEQPEGQTLWTFGEPMIQWLRHWVQTLHPDSGGKVEIRESVLNPAKGQLDQPAHALVQVTCGGTEADGIPAPQLWLLAESWWGSEIQRPAFRQLAGWMLTTGTWMIVSHALWPLRLQRRTPGFYVRCVVRTLVALVAAVLTQVGVLLLSVLAALPIPRLRQALSALLLRLTGVLGDSYVFVQNRIQQAAILTKVRCDLQWLAERCESVVVIAHSQGAAIAHRVLRHPDPRNVRLLITLGSGLAKLEELEALNENQAKLQIAYLSLPLLMLGTIICVRIYVHFLAEPTKLLAFTTVFLPVILVIATVMLVREHATKTQERIQQLSLSAFRPAMQWLDLYATCDPVPNGPLTNPGRLDNFESRAVTNAGSILHDHTSYWDNQSEVIAYILRKIDDQLKLGLFGENDLKLQVAGKQHRRAVLWRVGIWWANVVAALLIILQPNLSAWFGAMPSRKLAAWGESIQHAFTLGAPATLGKSLAVVGQVLAWVAGKRIPEKLTTLLLGAMVPIALLAIWYLAFRLIWKWLDRFTTRQVLDPRVPSNRKSPPRVLPRHESFAHESFASRTLMH